MWTWARSANGSSRLLAAPRADPEAPKQRVRAVHLVPSPIVNPLRRDHCVRNLNPNAKPKPKPSLVVGPGCLGYQPIRPIFGQGPVTHHGT
jgi:hypothetical protein